MTGSPPQEVEEQLFVLVAQFDAAAPSGAVELLAAQPTCARLRFVRATDVPDRWTLVAEFEGAAGYRAALSPFDVRTTVIPWLSTALAGSGVGETLLSADRGAILRHRPTLLH